MEGWKEEYDDELQAGTLASSTNNASASVINPVKSENT